MFFSKCIFCLLYIGLFILNLIYNELPFIGAITYRHMLSLLLLGFLWYQDREWLKLDKYFSIFLGFVAFWGLSSFVTGFGEAFLNKCLGTTLNAYVMYQSTKFLIKKYDALSIFVFVFICLGIIDAVLTILQYMGNPIGFAIPGMLGVDGLEEFEEYFSRRKEAGTTALVIPGLIGGALHGYFVACFTVISLYPFKNKLRLTNLFVWSLSIISLFYVQERSAFVLGTLGSLFVLYFLCKKMDTTERYIVKIIRVTSIVLITYIFSHISELLEKADMRYTAFAFDDLERSTFIVKTINYLFVNPIGGFFEYTSSGEISPHNVIINAFLWGGLAGGIIIICLLIRQFVIALYALTLQVKEIPFQALVFGIVFLVYTGNSMFHNESVVTGSATPWIYWAIFETYHLLRIDKKEDEYLYS